MRLLRLVCVVVLLLAFGAAVTTPGMVTPADALPGAPAVVTDACGPRPLKADGTPWRCTFVDDFTGSTLNRAKWLPQTHFRAGSPVFACYVDSSRNVSVGNGSLRLTVRKQWRPLACTTPNGTTSTKYTAGMVSTYHLFSQQYGRFEARMKNTATSRPGLQETFWLWPDDRVASAWTWPFGGEIDVSETYSQHPTLSVPYLHYAADVFGPLIGINTAWDCPAARGAWNTYRLDWGPDRIEIFVNGRSCLVNTSGDPAFRMPYILAFTAALGMGGNAYDGHAPLPATTSVDYVRVWQ